MSLDVYLYAEADLGETDGPTRSYVYSANYTHNMVPMAEKAGIYMPVWRPEDCGIRAAGDLIPILETAIRHMRNNPGEYIPLNPENGWGNYSSFVPWLEKYLEACKRWPKSLVLASR